MNDPLYAQQVVRHTTRPVLDVCCGARGFLFNPKDERAEFMDRRVETHTIIRGPKRPNPLTLVIAPDVEADFTAIPFPDESFWHVVFDPPHHTQAHIG